MKIPMITLVLHAPNPPAQVAQAQEIQNAHHVRALIILSTVSV